MRSRRSLELPLLLERGAGRLGDSTYSISVPAGPLAALLGVYIWDSIAFPDTSRIGQRESTTHIYTGLGYHFG